MFFEASKLSKACLASKPDVRWYLDNLWIAEMSQGLVNISNFLCAADPVIMYTHIMILIMHNHS